MKAEQLKALLHWRYAVRKFSNKKVSQATVNTLLEFTGLAPSSYGLQPYKIIQITDQHTKQQLLPHSYGQDKVAENSHLLIFAADMSPIDKQVDGYMDKFKRQRDLPTKTYENMQSGMTGVLLNLSEQQRLQWASEQAYIALGTLLITAASLGIDACPMTGFDNAAVDKALGLEKQQLRSVMLCPLGIRDISDNNADMPKVRKTLSELTMELSL